MHTIYKYKLQTLHNQTIEMPVNSKILCAKKQGEDICLWALVEVVNRDIKEPVKLHIFGTGWDIENYEDLEYIGTFFVDSGTYVFHIFKEK